MGHMLNQTEMRHPHSLAAHERRPRALWVPGTDHAGIATQMMVERQVLNEGTTRARSSAAKLLSSACGQWKRHYGGAILEQMKRLGDSVDWQREYFTMDEHLSVAVREAFVRLYEQGLIYRGAYIVNWCPRCQTAISDLEVVHQEQKGHLWEIRYPVLGDGGKETGEFITVATTRPETMLGDTAVAIHPEDERYLHLHGKKLRLPLMDREIPIVVDPWVSREFGTGAVKVTPAHDPNDFAIGERHHLPSINVMDDRAHINENGGAYAGLDRFAARKKIVADLEAQGLLGWRQGPHQQRRPLRPLQDRGRAAPLHAVVRQDPAAGRESHRRRQARCRTATRPSASRRRSTRRSTSTGWTTSTTGASRASSGGAIAFPRGTAPRATKSRCARVTTRPPAPTAAPNEITQETDVLDTWFSSGLLPVSVFGWPNIIVRPSWTGNAERADFDAFYPTGAPRHRLRHPLLLGRAHDHARLLVLARRAHAGRMAARGLDPRRIRSVQRGLHPRPGARRQPRKDVQDQGQRHRPHRDRQEYGTDAVRFTLATMASPGTDIAFNVARTEGYRAFANKIWNAARFIFMNVDRAAEDGITVDPSALGGMPTVAEDAPLEARWIVAELHATAAKVNQSLANYRFDEAANSSINSSGAASATGTSKSSSCVSTSEPISSSADR